MIRIKMGGYVDQNDKIITKEELDAWIVETQSEIERLQKQVSDITSMWMEASAENARLREALERIDNECGRDDTTAWKIAGDALEALKGGE